LALKYSVPLTLVRKRGYELDEPETISLTNTVPAVVPSVFQSSIPVAGTCYDLKLGQNNKLYACGIGFVSEINLTGFSQTVSTSSTPSSGCACNGTATATVACNSASIYNFSWSPGNYNTQTATGLCPGNYTVTLSSACTNMFTASVNVTGTTGGLALNSTQNNLSCTGNLGGATVQPSGGVAPYTYQWLPETGLDDASTPNPVYSGNQSQSYLLVVTDNRGCTARDTINIVITGFADINDDDLLLVYPNPGAGMIRLKMKEGIKQSSLPICLYSSTGKLIFKMIWENVKDECLVDVSTLASANYILSIGEGKGLISRKVMINK